MHMRSLDAKHDLVDDGIDLCNTFWYVLQDLVMELDILISVGQHPNCKEHFIFPHII